MTDNNTNPPMTDKTALSSLPDWCYAVLPSSGALIVVERDVRGYGKLSNTTNDRQQNRTLAREYNERMGITPQQEAAMLGGSMFGWDTPAARLSSYNEQGEALPPTEHVKERMATPDSCLLAMPSDVYAIYQLKHNEENRPLLFEPLSQVQANGMTVDRSNYELVYISKFYQSIDNDVLKGLFRRVIKDKRTLELIDAIIDSTQGLNIGNFTSQWFANFYLQGADHYIAEHLRHYERITKQGEVKRMDAITYNARYVDDMVLFGRNKKYMRWARDMLFNYLRDEMHLKIKGNWQLFLITTTKRRKDGSTYTAGRDLDFLGFKMNHERTILRRALSLRIARRARKIARKKQPTHGDAAAIVSYHGFLKHSDSHNFYTRRIAPYVDIGKMKGMIANDARKQQRTALAKSG